MSDRVYFNFILYQLELYDTINQQKLLAKRFAEHLQSSSNSNCSFSYLTFCYFFFSYFCFVCSCHKRKAICSVSCSRCPSTTPSRHPLAAPTLVAPSIPPFQPPSLRLHHSSFALLQYECISIKMLAMLS